MNWISIEQLAEEFGMKPKTLRNWMSSGVPMPPRYKFGRKTLFVREEVDKFIVCTRIETSAKAQGGRQ